jgi:hypothetical protein
MYSNFLSKEFNKYEINFSKKTWEWMKTKKNLNLRSHAIKTRLIGRQNIYLGNRKSKEINIKSKT